MTTKLNNRENLESSESVTERRVTNGFVVRFELLGVLLAIIVQTITAVWWGATVTTKMDYMQQAVAGLKIELNSTMSDRYTNKDAIKDFAVINDRITRTENRITAIENKFIVS